MNNPLKFIINGKPKAKQSTRFCKRGYAYTDDSIKNYQDLGKWFIKQQYQGLLIDYPITLEVIAHFPIKKSAAKKELATLIGAPYPLRPDGDNVLKMMCDILNGIVIKDDSLITSKTIHKKYALIGRVEIIINKAEV